MSLKSRRISWFIVFILAAGLIVILGAVLNINLIHDYRKMREATRAFSVPQISPTMTVVLALVGFSAALASLSIFFLRLLREMKLNQLQTDFLGSLSHELKTPLAAMELSASLLRTSQESNALTPILTPNERERLWDSHQMELQRLKNDLEALLEAARWGARNPTRSKPVRVHLETWLKESFSRWQKILGPEAVLKREGDALNAFIDVDPRTLSLITDNLMDNARKYSKKQPDVRVLTHLDRIRNRWQLSIEDHGLGFDPKERRKIFQRFYRTKSTEKKIPGTGLGLYLAHTASHSMGLRLSAQSSGYGQGSTFTLSGKGKRTVITG